MGALEPLGAAVVAVELLRGAARSRPLQGGRGRGVCGSLEDPPRGRRDDWREDVVGVLEAAAAGEPEAPESSRSEEPRLEAPEPARSRDDPRLTEREGGRKVCWEPPSSLPRDTPTIARSLRAELLCSAADSDATWNIRSTFSTCSCFSDSCKSRTRKDDIEAKVRGQRPPRSWDKPEALHGPPTPATA